MSEWQVGETDKWDSESMNESINQQESKTSWGCMWVNEWINEWLNLWKTTLEKSMHKWVSKQINGKESEWTNERRMMNEQRLWVKQWMSELDSEPVNYLLYMTLQKSSYELRL